MKKPIVLNKQLEEDCHRIGFINDCLLLLMDNSLAPWFILVPDTEVCEFYELDYKDQLKILDSVNRISAFLKNELSMDKINFATIGNRVSQLHIHVIGRKINDYCWPNVVWGAEEKQSYSANELRKLKSHVQQKVRGICSD